MKKHLSKYARKQLTPEEIAEHEKDIDSDGYELIDTQEYECYTIEIRKGKDFAGAVEWKVWNDFDDREDFAQDQKHLDRIIADLHEEMDDEIAFYDEEELT